MVDLVKIRKKAKERKEQAAARQTPAAAPESPAASPSRVRAAGPKPKPEGKAKPGKKESARRHHPRKEKAPPAAARPTPAAVDRLERFRETAGRLVRTEAAPLAAADSEAPLELLAFVLAGEQYAIDIERIAEIIAPRQATPVPNAPAPVVGIISLRGTIVTMLDLRRELGHSSNYAIGAETRTIVVEDGGGMAGFVVDRVLRVVKVGASQIQQPPVVSPAEQSEAIRGVFHHGESLTIVLDVERLLGRG
ncbi:MAG TPA: chemotaxis protein CheW [Thermoanaerobaculia bacterium]|nr:chemotaxis protein CheW [Thermoanaerobaculia bacterium]